MTNAPRHAILFSRENPTASASGEFRAVPIHNANAPTQPVSFGNSTMKKILAPLVTASIALISVQAFAQASEATPAAAAAPAKVEKAHKQLKHHGKRAAVEEAASAAGTADKGQQN
jgi:hypothetical protein